MSNESKRKLLQMALLLAASADAAILVAARPHPAELRQGLSAPHAWLAQAGSDQVLATLDTLWLVALWFAVSLAAVTASRVPGPVGRLAAGLAHVALPRAVVRLCAGALGAGVLLAPVTALAHPAGPPAGVASRAATSISSSHTPQTSPVPTPGWPTSTPIPAPTPVPTPSWPHGSPTTPPSTPPTTTPPPAPATPSTGPTTATAVRVQPGDSLWLIAARRLGPNATPGQITAQWQQWYAANRAVIGTDPGLIHPGQVLTPPSQH